MTEVTVVAPADGNMDVIQQKATIDTNCNRSVA